MCQRYSQRLPQCALFRVGRELPHTQGGFAEHIVVRQDQIRVLPTTLPLSRAVLAEPLAVGLHALNRAFGVGGAKVLVSGSGPIGILAAGAAKMAGAEEVWTTDLLEEPLKIALDVGVDRAVRIGADELPDQYFDVAIEASGAPVALGSVLAAVRRRGVMVQLGMFHPGRGPLNCRRSWPRRSTFAGPSDSTPSSMNPSLCSPEAKRWIR